MLRVGDYILIITIFCISIYLYPYFIDKFSSDSTDLVVTVDGKEYGRYDITKNQEILIQENNVYNRIVIENGIVNMVDANCSDRLCVHSAPIESSYQSIACLPNKVLLTIDDTDNESNNDYELDGFAS